MTKKENTQSSVASKLVISKDEFKIHILSCIESGKNLLSTDVKIIRSNYYVNPPAINYDETEYLAFKNEYKKWEKRTDEILKNVFDKSNSEYRQEFENSVALILYSKDYVKDLKKDIQLKITTLESFIDRLDFIPIIQKNENIKHKEENNYSNKVFIVHGHNDKVKIDVARTLEKLGLSPIILHEQTDGGKTIIEKFEKNAIDAGFAVILLTADDEGKAKRDVDYKDRARQNVVFEMGYFMAKLGRDRVLLLLDKGVEKPGDLDGIVYTPIDEHDAWKYKLVKEMKAVGYSVSADSL